MNRRLLWEIGIVGAIVIGLYAYLTRLDDPAPTLFELLKAAVKLILNFVTLGFAGQEIKPHILMVYWDVLLLLVCFSIFAAFFIQFALPVRNFVQRILAFTYLGYFLSGQHGPRTVVENGVVREDAYPKNNIKGRNVLILDTASAGLLRTPVEFTRTIGPGLVFTRKNEYLGGMADLHRKVWPDPPDGFGPRGDEDPFEPFNEKKEPREAFEHRNLRRLQTNGETRDGVEVVPNIFASCMIDSESDLHGPKWGTPRFAIEDWLLNYMESQTWTFFSSKKANRVINREAVRMAITGEEINPRVPLSEIDRRRLPWYQLPAYITIDLWREYLRKFTFEELFTKLPEHKTTRKDKDGNTVEDIPTAFQVIQKKVAERLTLKEVEEISPQGKPTGVLRPSYEFQVLRERGVKVLFVSIRNLHFLKSVDQQLEDKWFAYWKWRAEDEREYVDRLRSYKAHEGEKDALREFGFTTAAIFDDDQLNQPRSSSAVDRADQMRTAVEKMVRGTLRMCLDDTMLHQRLLDEEAQLIAIIDWLRRQRG